MPGGFLSFQHITSAALAVALAASGLVPLQPITFVLLSSLYTLFLSKTAFPTLTTTPHPPIFAAHQRLLTIYVSIGALVGLILPVAYILHAVLQPGNNKQAIKATAPHLFLLASQVLMEGVTFYCGFSLPVRVFVPVSYNAVRMVAILDWVKVMMEGDGYVGKVLAVANLGFWGFNLFGFLLPVYLPRAFNKYYADVVDDDKDKDS